GRQGDRGQDLRGAGHLARPGGADRRRGGRRGGCGPGGGRGRAGGGGGIASRPVAAAAPAADPLGEALALGYRALGRRDRTVSEVRGYLRSHGCEDAVVEEALAELGEQGYL